jgi:hypothetical protein
MEFNLTAKDKHALKRLAVDLRDSLKTKKGEGPQFTYFKDISFFKTAEGKQLDDLIDWVQDFIKRFNDAQSKQPEQEKEQETQELTNAGWLGKINPE